MNTCRGCGYGAPHCMCGRPTLNIDFIKFLARPSVPRLAPKARVLVSQAIADAREDRRPFCDTGTGDTIIGSKLFDARVLSIVSWPL